MNNQHLHPSQIIDRLKRVRGHLTKKEDKDTILCAIDLLREMKVKFGLGADVIRPCLKEPQ